jgi:hypothetical protein
LRFFRSLWQANRIKNAVSLTLDPWAQNQCQTMTKQSLSRSYPAITKVYMDPNYTQYMFLISGLQYRTGFRVNGLLQGDKKVVSLTGLSWNCISYNTARLVKLSGSCSSMHHPTQLINNCTVQYLGSPSPVPIRNLIISLVRDISRKFSRTPHLLHWVFFLPPEISQGNAGWNCPNTHAWVSAANFLINNSMFNIIALPRIPGQPSKLIGCTSFTLHSAANSASGQCQPRSIFLRF